ncbi:hypothetical protein BP5796_12633 [Coleophoma crateriformis]|uniref:Zn(2)-C6 fungal-type domain-containing protein n=1 Tax=Coleophoma crateriformis TaxID=565419 RepID=A0A3D8Q7N8_9HELO|nr:hypothetical protein BP5796_12633 [Coleophoma crateriformis]
MDLPRRLLPRVSAEQTHREAPSKSRHKKSRDGSLNPVQFLSLKPRYHQMLGHSTALTPIITGCVTCKARRRKCDENRPSCSQCIRRRVICGGYSKDLRWIEFEKPEQLNSPARKITGGTNEKRLNKTRLASHLLQPSESGEIPGGHEPGHEPLESRSNHALPRISGSEDNLVGAITNPDIQHNGFQFLPTPNPAVDMSLDTCPNLDFSFSDINTTEASQLADLNLFFSDISTFEAPEHQSSLPTVSLGTTESDARALLPDVLDLHSESEIIVPADMILGDTSHSVSPGSRESEKWPPGLPSLRRDDDPCNVPVDPTLPSSPNTEEQNIFNLYQQPRVHRVSPENIALLFDRRICEVLCIREDPRGNPWRTLVWPLAQAHPALYHAVAAMTCFEWSRSLPRFRAEGIRHFDSSLRKLSREGTDGMCLEVALAVRLVLGFAQTWHYPRSSNGISHIKRARTLLKKALSRDLASRPPEENLCLGFLANTWIYLDVMTRITCHNVQAVDFDLMAACRLISCEASSRSQIDPLMGCAATLFPLIGRVADLVSRVRRTEKPNSLLIVSQAVELKTNIERWIPLINAEVAVDAESLTLSTSDLVQTANAYKWATLLLLHQAVPELPRQVSFSQISQKVLVLIATVPLDSRASIFHILPLMIAGCETTDEGDRNWVRDRWQALTTWICSGIVERCLDLTLEVWRRRDSYKKRHDLYQPSPVEKGGGSLRPLSSEFTDVFTGYGSGNSSRPQPGDEFQHLWKDRDPIWSSVLGDSAACTRDNDPTMTAGMTEYTIKNKLHWLSIMEDWDWEGKLSG